MRSYFWEDSFDIFNVLEDVLCSYLIHVCCSACQSCYYSLYDSLIKVQNTIHVELFPVHFYCKLDIAVFVDHDKKTKQLLYFLVFRICMSG